MPLIPGPTGSQFTVGRNDVPGPRKSVLGFLSARVLEIATRAARGEQAPILSLPTRHGGAIDPEVLASRRRQVKAARFDVIQAALRAGEVKPATTIRLHYESPTAKHFQLVTDPLLPGQRELTNVPGLFVAALSSPYSSLDQVTARELDVASQIERVHQVDAGSAEAVRWVGMAQCGRRIASCSSRWAYRSLGRTSTGGRQGGTCGAISNHCCCRRNQSARWGGCCLRLAWPLKSPASTGWRLTC